jgi:hypothetical protein
VEELLFLITQHANAKITLTQKRYSLKLVNMKNIHVLQTAQPAGCFISIMRLEHNTVERKTNRTSTSLLMKN